MSHAVTAECLLPTLSRIWRNGLSKEALHGPGRIGVCVSGGPDSIALAYLLKQAPRTDPGMRVEPLAFIVNHNARPKSRKEAHFVARYLEKLETVVLDIDWGKGLDPTSLPDFEMLARRARYRLIAGEAIRRNIHHLFLGHHQDDQVETILMRLIRNPNTSFLGLQGMSEQSAVPCCEDIRGAHELEQYERFPHWLHQFDRTIYNDIEDNDSVNFGKQVTVARPDGLLIHRPLLQFPKSRLLETCKENGIIYQRDKTNDDPTLTLRNAIRQLRRSQSGLTRDQHLPRALQARSILQLCDRARELALSLVERGTDILRRIKVDTFDLRSGMMTISLSKGFVAACEADPAAGANALARLTSVVSYQSRDDVPTLVPHDRLVDFLEAMRSRGPKSLTIQKVLLEMLEVEGSSIEFETVNWRLSRPPMRSSEIRLVHQGFLPKIAQGDIGLGSSSTCQSAVDAAESVWSEWLLWDHRYWVRVRAKSAASLSEINIRPYQASDAAQAFGTTENESARLRRILAQAAPGKTRYTLPVLTVRGRISVFPTLNIIMPEDPSKENGSTLTPHSILEWEICYKVMDQPFINEQVKTIEWRNAMVNRR
ncbi:hypothetical protein A1O1_02523 [Capronia coronata CBS 617.96]|uniref:tRNA(Ile)-lysidine synthetase n=1 Tax=Capronia coronata CBS 617.96 TaxID=1182541 RepID=W9YWR8_9EURO|nr:uncharacterized protein A1O1_02523 [Capronia coronata CBS 617.96]EXJ94130.1 hypothetical protein A1O1_02523 [Capronia coronata CBS 617.96]